MKSKYFDIYILTLTIILIIFISGCIHQTLQSSTELPDDISNSCINACKDALNSGKDLSSGPCILDPMPIDSDWVCDIVHDPRQSIDNQPENQCQSYRNGTSHHFIELTPDCKFIRAR